MSALIVSGGVARLPDVLALREAPELRKATTPMLLALCAVERCLATLPVLSRSDWGLVVGVDYGELEVTKEFLHTLASRGVARPFLFQNALHNAALGFLSRRLEIRGPGATTSTHWFAGEDALALAVDFVTAGDCDACLCVGVEDIDADMRAAVEAVHGAGTTAGSGAGAVLVASQGFVAASGLAARSRAVRAIHCERQARAAVPGQTWPGFFGAEAVMKLVEAMQGADEALDLTLSKPDGSFSRLCLSSPS
jgi:hypothetical protein